jgi:uncharacterized protein DUF5916/cellulose/xylan binding protein with CBM9 domain
MRAYRIVVLSASVVALAGTTGLGAQADFRPNVKPSLAVTRAAGPITIDGELGDPGWAGAARAVNFTEISPRENVRPDVETEAWITYDDKHLYVAIIARDDPRTIRSSLTDRDAIFQDDFAGILLDTYGDASWAYYLLANPKGIQGDLRFSASRGDDSRFDIIYKSDGKLTADGYVVEMAIPFASLRFPDRPVQTWRATFWRNRPRSSKQEISWAAARRGDPCELCQYGTLTGIEGIKPGGALELIPAAVATHSSALDDADDPASRLRSGTVDGDLSLTAKYSFKSGLTAEATVNPDFSQVESDASQVDVNTTFALSFPERRPFFQEGGDLFGTNLSIVYTRNINDPLAAVKLVQRTGRSSIAYLGARDDNSPILLPFEERSFTARGGKSISNIVRGRRTFGRNSWLGAILTDRRLSGGGGGTVAGIDGTIAFAKYYQLEFQLVGSRTREPDDPSLTTGVDTLTFDRGRHSARFDGESFKGYGQYTSVERSGRTWSFDFDYYASSPTFRTDNGFETRNNSRRVSMYQSLNFYWEDGLLERISPSLSAQRGWNFEGDRKSQSLQLSVDAQLKGQLELDLELRTSDERFRGEQFQGLDRVAMSVESAFSEVFHGGFSVDHGERLARNTATPVVGRGTDVEAFATIRPASWIALRPSYEHSDLSAGGERIFSGYILRNRADLQFTRGLFLRLVVEYDNFDRALIVEPLLTYRLNPFSLIYLGSSRGYREFDGPSGWTRTETQYFAKVQYLIRK